MFSSPKRVNARDLFLLGVRSLMIAFVTIVPSASQDPSGNQHTRNRFVGAWRLAWLEEEGADGKVHKADCSGLLVSTRDGHISVQIMYRNPEPSNGSAPMHYAQGGYEASFGRYEIDNAHTLTFHVDVALVRTLVGKDLKRSTSFPANSSS